MNSKLKEVIDRKAAIYCNNSKEKKEALKLLNKLTNFRIESNPDDMTYPNVIISGSCITGCRNINYKNINKVYKIREIFGINFV